MPFERYIYQIYIPAFLLIVILSLYLYVIYYNTRYKKPFYGVTISLFFHIIFWCIFFFLCFVLYIQYARFQLITSLLFTLAIASDVLLDVTSENKDAYLEASNNIELDNSGGKESQDPKPTISSPSEPEKKTSIVSYISHLITGNKDGLV